MIRQTNEKGAELLLPLAGGLLVVGTNSTVPLGGAGLLGLLVLLASEPSFPSTRGGRAPSRQGP